MMASNSVRSASACSALRPKRAWLTSSTLRSAACIIARFARTALSSMWKARNPATAAPYLDREGALALQAALLADGDNGLWDVTPATIRAQATAVADAFGLSLDEAAE